MPLPVLPLALAAVALLALGAGGGSAKPPAPGPGPGPTPSAPPNLDDFRDQGLPPSVWTYQRRRIEDWAKSPANLGAFARWCLTVGSPGPAVGALYVAQVAGGMDPQNAQAAAAQLFGLTLADVLDPQLKNTDPSTVQTRTQLVNALSSLTTADQCFQQGTQLAQRGLPRMAAIYIARGLLIGLGSTGAAITDEAAQNVITQANAAVQRVGATAGQTFEQAVAEVRKLPLDGDEYVRAQARAALDGSTDAQFFLGMAPNQWNAGAHQSARALWRMGYLYATRDPMRAIEMSDAEVAARRHTVPALPTDVAQFIQAQKASGTPQALTTAAAWLRANGYPEQAAELDELARAAILKAPPPDLGPVSVLQPGIPANLAELAARALRDQGDPAVLLKLAAQMRAAGLTKVADELEAKAVGILQAASLAELAKEIERQIAAAKKETGGTTSPGLPTKPPVVQPPVVQPPTPVRPPVVAPPVVAPPVIAPPPVVAPPVVAPPVIAPPPVVAKPDPITELAQDIALSLLALHPYQKGTHGKERKDLVQAFQKAKGLQVDGKYGSGVAIALAQHVMNVPPVLYWGKNDVKTPALVVHRQRLLQMADAADKLGQAERAAFLRLSAVRETGQGGIPGYAAPLNQVISLDGVTLNPKLAYLDRINPR